MVVLISWQCSQYYTFSMAEVAVQEMQYET